VTAGDDAIIITDQSYGLAPSNPVTIDAPAAAHTATLSDLATIPRS
jgi:hypothetical protein